MAAYTHKRSQQERMRRDGSGVPMKPARITRPEVDSWLSDLLISVQSLNTTPVEKLRGRINGIESRIKTFRELLGVQKNS